MRFCAEAMMVREYLLGTHVHTHTSHPAGATQTFCRAEALADRGSAESSTGADSATHGDKGYSETRSG